MPARRNLGGTLWNPIVPAHLNAPRGKWFRPDGSRHRLPAIVVPALTGQFIPGYRTHSRFRPIWSLDVCCFGIVARSRAPFDAADTEFNRSTNPALGSA